MLVPMSAHANLRLDIGEGLTRSLDQYKANIILLVVGALLAVLVGLLTVGFLSAVMMGGMVGVALKLYAKTEPKPDIGAVFKGFDQFADLFLFGLVWYVGAGVAAVILQFIPCLGNLLGVALSLLIMMALFFAIPLIVDRRMPFWTASMASIHLFKENAVPVGIFAFVASIIGSSGAILCGIGIFFTAPFLWLMMAYGYNQIKESAELQRAIDKASGTPVATPEPPATEG